MYDESRLEQLIAEAKMRRDDARAQQVKSFKAELLNDLSDEVCNILGMTFQGDEQAGSTRGDVYIPRAKFTGYGFTWSVRRWADTVSNVEDPPKWVIDGRNDAGGSRTPGGFTTRDEFLLLLDRLSQITTSRSTPE